MLYDGSREGGGSWTEGEAKGGRGKTKAESTRTERALAGRTRELEGVVVHVPEVVRLFRELLSQLRERRLHVLDRVDSTQWIAVSFHSMLLMRLVVAHRGGGQEDRRMEKRVRA